MYVSRRKRLFVASAVLAMLAAQTQSCASGSGVEGSTTAAAGSRADGGAGAESTSGGIANGASGTANGAGGRANGSAGNGASGVGAGGANFGSAGAAGGTAGSGTTGATGQGGALGSGSTGSGSTGSAGAAGRSPTGGAGGVGSEGGARNGTGGSGLTDQSLVAVVQSTKDKASDLTLDDVRTLVTQAVTLAGGLSSIVHDGQTVVLKPNLLTIGSGSPLPAEVNGVTADWRVTKVVAELVRKLDPSGKILVMEGSTSSTTAAFTQYKYTKENIPEVDEFIALESSGTYGDPNANGLVVVTVPDGKYIAQGKSQSSYSVNKRYYQADVVISIPVMKTHLQAVVTGAVKNLAVGATPASVYGVSASNPSRNQTTIPHAGDAMHRWIHDYYRLKPANFAVMDALQALQNGPYSGWTGGNIETDRMNMRLILASRDSIALDTIESLIVGWDPKTIPYLGLLDASNVGTADPGKIRVLGKRVDEVRKTFSGGSSCAVKTCARISDSVAPQLSVSTHSVSAGMLSLSLQSNADLYKVEVYAGSTLLEPVIRQNFANIQLDVKSLPAQTYDLKIIGYDYYLNATLTTLAGVSLP